MHSFAHVRHRCWTTYSLDVEQQSVDHRYYLGRIVDPVDVLCRWFIFLLVSFSKHTFHSIYIFMKTNERARTHTHAVQHWTTLIWALNSSSTHVKHYCVHLWCEWRTQFGHLHFFPFSKLSAVLFKRFTAFCCCCCNANQIKNQSFYFENDVFSKYFQRD